MSNKDLDNYAQGCSSERTGKDMQMTHLIKMFRKSVWALIISLVRKLNHGVRAIILTSASAYFTLLRQSTSSGLVQRTKRCGRQISENMLNLLTIVN